MTKAEAKKLIKEYYKPSFETLEERIVDWNLWKDGGEWMYSIITISKNHIPYKCSGYIDGEQIIGLHEATGLLTISR